MKRVVAVLLAMLMFISVLSPLSFSKKNSDEKDIKLMNKQFEYPKYDSENNCQYWEEKNYTYIYLSYEEAQSECETETVVNSYSKEEKTMYHSGIKRINNDTGEEEIIIRKADQDIIVANGYIYYIVYIYSSDDIADRAQKVDVMRCDLNGDNEEKLYTAPRLHGTGIGTPTVKMLVTAKYLYLSLESIVRIDLKSKDVKTVYDRGGFINLYFVYNDKYYFRLWYGFYAAQSPDGSGLYDTIEGESLYEYDSTSNKVKTVFSVQGKSKNSDGSFDYLVTVLSGKQSKQKYYSDYDGLQLTLAETSPLVKTGLYFDDKATGDVWFYNFKSGIIDKVIGDKGSIDVSFVIDKVPGSTTLNYNSSWFGKDSDSYNHNISKLASQLVMLGYADNKMLKTSLEQLGFEDVVQETNAGRNEVNYYMAHKEIHIDGESYNLLAAGFIGSYYHQWYSNFDPKGKDRTEFGDDKDNCADDSKETGIHLGFADARQYIYNKMDDYIRKLNNNLETKIFLAGHSRGGATANLLGAKLIKEEGLHGLKLERENIFTYTYAAPNNASFKRIHSDETETGMFNRIFNIVNPEDFVTKVLPTAWKYGKYGTVYALPNRSNMNQKKYINHLKQMRSKFEVLCKDQLYKPYEKGTYAVDKVIYIMSQSVKNLEEFYEKEFRLNFKKLSTYEFFKKALCPFVATSKKVSKEQRDLDKEKANKAQDLMIKAAIPNVLTSGHFYQVSLFFIGNEGLYSATRKSDKEFKSIISEWKADIIENFGSAISSSYFSHAHMAQTYCAYMLSLDSKQAQSIHETNVCSTNCPIDVEVYEKESGDLVGRIIDNKVDETIAKKDNAVVMVVDGDKKQYYLPKDTAYEVKLIGNDEGEMNQTISFYDSDSGELARSNYYNLPVKSGKIYTFATDIEEEDLQNKQLINDNNKAIDNDAYFEFDEEHTVSDYIVEVKTIAKGNGVVSDSVNALPGDRVTMLAKPEEGEEFNGWYNNGKKVSELEEYSFVVKDTTTLEAKFSNHNFIKTLFNNPVFITIIGLIMLIMIVLIIAIVKKHSKRSNTTN